MSYSTLLFNVPPLKHHISEFHYVLWILPQMSLWCCFVAHVERNESGGCILKGSWCDLWGPGCLSLRSSQYCEIQHCYFHICTSLEYIIETHWNPVEKQTLVLAIFSCISCLCTLWNANEVIALHCGFSDVLHQSNISLMSVAISVHLYSDAFYSQSNACSYLCNSCAERTPSVETSFVNRFSDCVFGCVFCCHQAFPYMYFCYKLPCLSCLNICLVCNFKSHFTQITNQLIHVLHKMCFFVICIKTFFKSILFNILYIYYVLL